VKLFQSDEGKLLIYYWFIDVADLLMSVF